MLTKLVIVTYITCIVLLLVCPLATSCDVLVISSHASKNARPIIWKNRDDPAGFYIGIKKRKASNPDIGSYICIEEKLYPDMFSICSAGLNEAGFAIANTSAYTGSTFKELINIDEPILERALNICKSVACFEKLLIEAHNYPNKFYVTSSNFVAIDSSGGAVHYEAYADLRQPVDFIKHDANIEHFSNKTNYIDLHKIYDSTSEKRAHRATDLLTYYYNKNELTPKTVMQEISKDVCDDDTSQNLNNFNTSYCISRAYTRLGVVIEGVAPGEDPRLATMWVNLGEPSLGVYVPVYPAARFIPEAVKANNLGSAPLNVAILNRKLESGYENLGSVNMYVETFPLKDMHIDKIKLYQLQNSITFPIENTLVDNDRQIKESLRRNSTYNIEETLKKFSEDFTLWAYQVYSGRPKLPEDSNKESLDLWLKAASANISTIASQITTEQTTNQLRNTIENATQAALPFLEQLLKSISN
jgi:hypothetical protein